MVFTGLSDTFCVSAGPLGRASHLPYAFSMVFFNGVEQFCRTFMVFAVLFVCPRYHNIVDLVVLYLRLTSSGSLVRMPTGFERTDADDRTLPPSNGFHSLPRVSRRRGAAAPVSAGAQGPGHWRWHLWAGGRTGGLGGEVPVCQAMNGLVGREDSSTAWSLLPLCVRCCIWVSFRDGTPRTRRRPVLTCFGQATTSSHVLCISTPVVGINQHVFTIL